MARAEPQAAVTENKPVVYLHLGTPKSGTTYLQNILWRNRDALRKSGVLYPGAVHQAHFLAAIDQQEIDFRGHRDPRAEGAWDGLVREAREWTGPVVISHEVFCAASEEKARAALAALDFADVHLILTVRDLARQIPAAWQEDLKNRYVMGFGDYVDAVRDRGDAEQAGGFWRMQDPADILRRWAADVDPARVHVVTVPPSGAPPTLLWERFAGVTGIDPEWCDLSSVPANPGLGAVEAALLRRINENLDRDAVDWPTYETFVKFRLSERGLAGRPGREPVRLPATERNWVAAWSERLVMELTERGYAVTGDLSELIPAEPGTANRHPDDITDTAMFEASLDGIAHLVGELGDQRKRLMNRNAELEKRTKALEEARSRLAETERRLDEAEKAMIAAYERPVYRQAAHRVADRLPAFRPVLRHFADRRDQRSGGAPE
ncbi:hypothetical protein ACFHW2_06905 [Actinomadura sp. LOL_016]|uniref:hypothetical protein n=1 Tax=unclassified Actinomadura TaxID=2626254 RepID=UPI003A7FE3F6